MLKILDVGNFKCEQCKDGKNKKGVVLQCIHGRIQAPVAMKQLDGSEKMLTHGYRYIWYVQETLCLTHLKAFLVAEIDNPSMAMMFSDEDVNITYEEAKAKGVMRRDYIEKASEQETAATN